MEDKVLKKFPQEIKVQEALIIYYQSDIETARENTPESREVFPPMEIKGTVYHDKKEAGQALIEACKALSEMKGEMIGKYRGFSMELSYSSYASEFAITLQGKMEHKVALGTDIFGNITRIDNEIEKFPDKMERCRAKLENLKLQMENGKKELEKEFPHEKELAEKTARLAELNVLLDMDKKDHVVMEEEPEEEREERGREKEKER